MLIFDDRFKEELYLKAGRSERLRAHHNIHTSFDEKVQRLAIALMQGTYIPPHQHVQSSQWEFFHVIEGTVKLLIFSEHGDVVDILFLGDQQPVFAVQLPPGTLHTLICVSERAFLLEWKEGPFQPELAKSIPLWSVEENSPDASFFLSMLECASVNDKVGL